MVKKFNAKKTTDNAVRLLINIVIAGINFTVATSLLNTVTTTAGIIVSSMITLLVLIVVIPMIFQIRKGPETLVDLIIAIPAGLILVTLVVSPLTPMTSDPTCMSPIVCQPLAVSILACNGWASSLKNIKSPQ